MSDLVDFFCSVIWCHQLKREQKFEVDKCYLNISKDIIGIIVNTVYLIHYIKITLFRNGSQPVFCWHNLWAHVPKICCFSLFLPTSLPETKQIKKETQWILKICRICVKETSDLKIEAISTLQQRCY